MNERRIGARTLMPIGLGGMALSSIYHPTDDEASEALIRYAVDRGVEHFDTSDAYGAGHNERLFGRALRSVRDSVFIATKFGSIRHPDGTRSADGRPEYVHQACDASLERLDIEHIDLYYIHRVDPDTPIEETVGAMAELVSAGKVAALGISEAAPATVRRAHATHPIAAMQVEHSLWTRFAGDELIPLCDELDMAFVAYSPLGRGFLTGTIKSPGDLGDGDRRRGQPRFRPDHLERNLEPLRVAQDVALDHGASPAQVALAWVLAQSPRIHAIPSTRTPGHLDENVAAAGLRLTARDLRRLDEAFEPLNIAGDRYDAAAAALVQV